MDRLQTASKIVNDVRRDAVLTTIDDALIERVFQPTVNALGVKTRVLLRWIRFAMVASTFGLIAEAWIGHGRIDASGILILPLLTWVANSNFIRQGRIAPFGAIWRLLPVAIFLYDIANLLLENTLHGALLLVFGALWVSESYVQACQGAPPRHGFAFAPVST